MFFKKGRKLEETGNYVINMEYTQAVGVLPVKVVENLNYTICPPLPGHKPASQNIVEFPVSHMTIVFTDGKQIGESETKYFNSDGQNVSFTDKKDLVGKGEIKKVKDIYIKDYTYVVVYSIAQEWRTIENVCGFFDIVKGVKYYLKDKNDKDALGKVNEIIEGIKTLSKNIDCSSLLNLVLSPQQPSMPKVLERRFNPFDKK